MVYPACKVWFVCVAGSRGKGFGWELSRFGTCWQRREGPAHWVSGYLYPSPKLKADRRTTVLAFSSPCSPAQDKVPLKLDVKDERAEWLSAAV